MIPELNTKILKKLYDILPRKDDYTSFIGVVINFFSHALHLRLGEELKIEVKLETASVEINGVSLAKATHEEPKQAKLDACYQLLKVLKDLPKFYVIEVFKALYGKIDLSFTDNEKYLLEYLFQPKGENEVLFERYGVENYELRNAPLKFTKIMSKKYSEHKKLITGYVSWPEELLKCFNGDGNLTKLVLQYANKETELDLLTGLKFSPNYTEDVLDLILQYCLWSDKMDEVLPVKSFGVSSSWPPIMIDEAAKNKLLSSVGVETESKLEQIRSSVIDTFVIPQFSGEHHLVPTLQPMPYSGSLFEVQSPSHAPTFRIMSSGDYGNTLDFQEIIGKQKNSTITNESSEAKAECSDGNPNQSYNPPNIANSITWGEHSGDAQHSYLELGNSSNIFDN